MRAVLDQFRRKLAITAAVLQETNQQQIRRRCEQHLNEFWGLDPERRRAAHCNALRSRGPFATACRWIQLGERSTLGRFLASGSAFRPTDYRQVPGRASWAAWSGRVDLPGWSPSTTTSFSSSMPLACSGGWAMAAAAARSALLPPAPGADGYAETPPPVNAFFQRFYRERCRTLAALEAREHTAQVVKPGERERRERRFRWETSDTTKEADSAARLALPGLLADDGTRRGHRRPRPGPPAQRATHAGQLRPAQRTRRTPRAAGTDFHLLRRLNSHDQYFFHRREDMVAGSVRPPRLDIANEALVRAHLACRVARPGATATGPVHRAGH